MDSPTNLPLYIQISEQLTRDMAAGRLLEGERLSPERDMAVRLGVSVGTLRKALDLLEQKGLIERRQGSGNYVRKSGDIDNVYAFFRLELLEGTGQPTARYLTVERMEKPATLPAFGKSDEAFRIRRLRHIGDKCVALEEIWLDGALTDHVKVPDLLDSLYLYYRTDLGLWPSRAEDRMGLAVVPDWTVDEFQPRAGATIPLVERLTWDQKGETIEFSRTWFDSDLVRYVSRLK